VLPDGTHTCVAKKNLSDTLQARAVPHNSVCDTVPASTTNQRQKRLEERHIISGLNTGSADDTNCCINQSIS